MKCCATCERERCTWVTAHTFAHGCDLWAPDAMTKAVMLNEDLRREQSWWYRLWRLVTRRTTTSTEEG